jgi:hypothetical protein
MSCQLFLCWMFSLVGFYQSYYKFLNFMGNFFVVFYLYPNLDSEPRHKLIFSVVDPDPVPF